MFFKNDSYFPRPGAEGSVDDRLWKKFVNTYITLVDGLLPGLHGKDGLLWLSGADVEKRMSLARCFIERVVEAQRKRLADRA